MFGEHCCTYLSVLTGSTCGWKFQICCSGVMITYGLRWFLHFEADCSRGKYFEHADSGEWCLFLMCGNHVPWRHDVLTQCCRITQGTCPFMHVSKCQTGWSIKSLERKRSITLAFCVQEVLERGAAREQSFFAMHASATRLKQCKASSAWMRIMARLFKCVREQGWAELAGEIGFCFKYTATARRHVHMK